MNWKQLLRNHSLLPLLLCVSDREREAPLVRTVSPEPW